MAINITAPIGNTALIDRKPVLRKLPGIHVSEGPLCKDNRFPVAPTVSFYQHLFSLPVSVQSYLQQILACFKLKKKLDQEALENIRRVLIDQFKAASSAELDGRRATLIAHYMAALEKKSKRSHPQDLLSILLKFCGKKTTKKTSIEQDLIAKQLKQIDQLLQVDS